MRNVVQLVSTDHRRAQELLDRLARGRRNLADARHELVALLGAHLHAMTSAVAPIVVEVAPEVTASQAEPDIRSALAGVSACRPDDHGFARAVERLAAELAAHAVVEEEWLRAAIASLDLAQRRRVATSYARARDRHVRHLEQTSAPVPRRYDLPRTVLYEQARRAGIEGRSSMSREQLVAALLDHERRQAET